MCIQVELIFSDLRDVFNFNSAEITIKQSVLKCYFAFFCSTFFTARASNLLSLLHNTQTSVRRHLVLFWNYLLNFFYPPDGKISISLHNKMFWVLKFWTHVLFTPIFIWRPTIQRLWKSLQDLNTYFANLVKVWLQQHKKWPKAQTELGSQAMIAIWCPSRLKKTTFSKNENCVNLLLNFGTSEVRGKSF